MTDVTSGTGSDHRSGEPEFTSSVWKVDKKYIILSMTGVII
jgi:hypothetical protein